MPSHLGDDLCESTTGLVTDPHFVLGALCSADGLQLGVDRLVRERLDAELGLAGGVELQMVSQGGVRETLQVHKKPAERKGKFREECKRLQKYIFFNSQLFAEIGRAHV